MVSDCRSGHRDQNIDKRTGTISDTFDILESTMQLAATRSSQIFNLYGVLLLAVIALGGVVAVYSPAAAIGGSILVTGGIAALVFMRKSNLLVSIMTCYGLLIALPALLPRPAEDRENPAMTGALDTRAIAQLAIFAAVILIGCWLWLIAGTGVRHLIQSPLIIMVLYALLIGISLLYTPDIAWPAYGLFKLTALIIALGVLSTVIQTSSQLKRAIDFVVGALMVILGFYFFDIVRGAAEKASGRYRADWIHPNQITLIAVTVLLILTIRFLASSQPENRLRSLAPLGFAAVCALLAGSKSSLGAAAIALFIATLIILVKKPTGSMLARILALVLGMFGVVNYFLVNNIGIAAHLMVYEEANTDPTSLTGRVPVWQTAISDTLATPFSTIFGHGYLSTFSIGLEGEFWTARQSHNSFIQTFFDLGLIGVAIVATLYLSSWLSVWRAIARYSIFDSRWVRALEVLTALTAFTVVSLTEDIMGGTVETHTMLFLIIVFCAHKTLTVTRDDKLETPPEDTAQSPKSPTQSYLERVTRGQDSQSAHYPRGDHAYSADS